MRNFEKIKTSLCRDVQKRIEKLRKRALAVLKTGDPEQAKTIRLHTCHKAGQIKILDCDCTERVSLTTCSQMIEEGQVEWVRCQRRNGKIWVHRGAVAFTAKAEHGDSGEAPNPILSILAEQDAAQKQHALTLALKNEIKIKARKDKGVEKMLGELREKLTPEEDSRWNNEQLLYAVEHIDDEPAYLQGIGARNQIDTRLKNASKQGRLSQLIESDIYQSLANQARLKEALLKASTRFYDILLSAEGLSSKRPLIMPEAPKSRGLLVSGGMNESKLADIDAHGQEKEDENGKPINGRHVAAANFLPGSGGLEYGTEGGNRKSFDPIWTVGNSPEVNGPGDEHEGKQDAHFEAIPDNSFRGMRSQKQVEQTLSLESVLEQPQQEYPERDVFELAESQEDEERRIANILGISMKEARHLLNSGDA